MLKVDSLKFKMLNGSGFLLNEDAAIFILKGKSKLSMNIKPCVYP